LNNKLSRGSENEFVQPGKNKSPAYRGHDERQRTLKFFYSTPKLPLWTYTKHAGNKAKVPV